MPVCGSRTSNTRWNAKTPLWLVLLIWLKALLFRPITSVYFCALRRAARGGAPCHPCSSRRRGSESTTTRLSPSSRPENWKSPAMTEERSVGRSPSLLTSPGTTGAVSVGSSSKSTWTGSSGPARYTAKSTIGPTSRAPDREISGFRAARSSSGPTEGGGITSRAPGTLGISRSSTTARRQAANACQLTRGRSKAPDGGQARPRGRAITAATAVRPENYGQRDRRAPVTVFRLPGPAPRNGSTGPPGGRRVAIAGGVIRADMCAVSLVPDRHSGATFCATAMSASADPAPLAGYRGRCAPRR
jgi:hypothetical protein